MSGFTVAWILWIMAFVGIEGYALARKEKGDTLSEHVWKWFAVNDPHANQVWRWVGRVLLLTGGVWLTGHLAFGWWSF